MIRKSFQFLFGWPCDHDWETLVDGAPKTITHLDRERFEERTRIWLYRCTKCCKRREIST